MLACSLLVSLAMAACSESQHSPRGDRDVSGTSPPVTVIVHADAHTLSVAGRIENATIVLRGGKIIAIGADVEIPAGAEVIDAAGNPVTPGLISSATQLGLVEVSSSQDTVDRSESGGRLGASFDIQYGLNFNSVLIPIARADGLTHGIVMPDDSAEQPFAGIGALINVGTHENLLERSGVAMYAGIEGAATGSPGQSRSAQWIVLRRALTEARDSGGDGRGSDSAAELGMALKRADLEALRPVLEGRTPLVIRTKRESDIRQAVALGRDFGIRVILYDANEAWRAAKLLAEHQVPVILDPADNLPSRFDEIGSRLDNAAILHEAGVPLALHTSAFHMSHNAGLELRQAAGIAVANGLPWDAALEALTAGAASIWGIGDHIGRLETGMAADLVIWSGDPLEVTTWPLTVMIDGELMPLETRQTRLRDRYLPDARKTALSGH